MEVRFSDTALDRLETDAKYDAGFSAQLVKAFRGRMQIIRAFLSTFQTEVISIGQHSMRLNEQWRLIVEFEGVAPKKIVVVIAIEDYH